MNIEDIRKLIPTDRKYHNPILFLPDEVYKEVFGDDLSKGERTILSGRKGMIEVATLTRYWEEHEHLSSPNPSKKDHE